MHEMSLAQALVDQVIEFWENELSRVLPDKPDLIVLPEACDRPAGMNIDLQLKYFKARGNQVLELPQLGLKIHG